MTQRLKQQGTTGMETEMPNFPSSITTIVDSLIYQLELKWSAGLHESSHEPKVYYSSVFIKMDA